jgi:quercetin dioxygenase-like cupin family protein
MAHDVATYDEVEPLAPGMYFLRDELDCDNLGLTVVEADAGWDGKEHDHAEDDQEEVYLLLDGSAELTVDGETLDLDTGHAVRVDAGSTRQLSFDEESTMVIAGAP